MYFKEKEGTPITKYEVTVSAGSNGKVTVAPEIPADKKVAKGQKLTITATANSGYVVDKWTISGSSFESGSGADGSITAKVKVTANTTVNVTFKQQAVTPPPPPAYDFVEINPPAAGITGKDPTYTLPGPQNFWKGVFREGRKVTLSPYKLGKTEVPYEVWYEMRTWAESNGYAFANKGSEGKDGSEGATPTEGNKKHPVTKVSWRDCIVWCNAYTQKMNTADTDCVYRKKDDHAVVLKDATKDSECDAAYADMSKKGYRLPTEAEWEYAARWQGSDSTNAEQYGEVWLTKLNSASGAKGNWEDTEKTGEVAWYRGNADSKTHPVGTKKANALGLHDMSGNVWEWCFDRYDNIEAEDVMDPQGAASGTTRVIRGGGWGDDAGSCVVDKRIRYEPDRSYVFLGFRVAMSKN